MNTKYLMLTLHFFLLLSVAKLAAKGQTLKSAAPVSKQIESLDEQIEKFGEECDVEAFEADPDCETAAKLVEEKANLQKEEEIRQPVEIEEFETVEYE